MGQWNHRRLSALYSRKFRAASMMNLPICVKRRDSSGAGGAGTVCDSVAKALEVAAEFRLKGFVEIWFEDAAGRRLDEKALRDA